MPPDHPPPLAGHGLAMLEPAPKINLWTRLWLANFDCQCLWEDGLGWGAGISAVIFTDELRCHIGCTRVFVHLYITFV